MNDSKTTIFITKLEAARRQIDAAIRMFFLDEDALAVHTVGAAAYNILRDIKRKRGRSELSDGVKVGIFRIANDLVTGRIEDIPAQAKESSIVFGLLNSVVEHIKEGRVTNPSQINLFIGGEEKHWRRFNLPANFLKHADRDTTEAMDLEKIDNITLLASACRAFSEIMGTLTPEMETFICYACALDPEMGPGWSVDFDITFRKMSRYRQRIFCKRYLRETKREALSK